MSISHFGAKCYVKLQIFSLLQLDDTHVYTSKEGDIQIRPCRVTPTCNTNSSTYTNKEKKLIATYQSKLLKESNDALNILK